MSNWMPGAVQIPQQGGVTLDTSLPPRFVWHITWDQLRADGTQPEFSAVAGYLQREGYCPHIMWNPFTGYMEQYYPANVGGRALMFNNQDGAACIQVEVFFTPGCVVDGVRYDTVADTPLVGFEDLVAWGESLGVPRTWPMDPPQWQGNKRDAGIWNTNGGHYGHCHSPGDTHTDPGPMPALTGTITVQGAITTQSTAVTPEEVDMKAILATDGTSPDVWIGDGITRRKIATLDTLNSITALQGLFGLDATVQTVPDLWALGYPVDQAIESNIAGIPLAILTAQFRTRAGAIANVAGALSELLSTPAGTGVVDVDGLVARLKSELPSAVLSELTAKLAK